MPKSQLSQGQVEKILSILKKYGVRKASIFGSYARGVANAGSDLDLLIDPPKGATLLTIGGIKMELSEALGMDVHITLNGKRRTSFGSDLLRGIKKNSITIYDVENDKE